MGAEKAEDVSMEAMEDMEIQIEEFKETKDKEIISNRYSFVEQGVLENLPNTSNA